MSPNPFWNAYTECLNTAQKQASTCSYSLWQMPAVYWQTVSSIMGLRSASVLTLQQAWAEFCTTLATCKTPAQVAACLNTYQQQAMLCCTDLNVQTHKYRAELWHNWQVLAQRCTPQHNSHTSWMHTATPTPSYSQTKAPEQPKPYTAPTPCASVPSTPAPTFLKGWFVAGPTPKSTPVTANSTPTTAQKPAEPIKAVQPTPQPEAAKPQAPRTEPKPQQSQTAQESLPMAVGQSYSSATPIVSSTADSVMRIGNAASAASAAATRRSVLARHSTRKSRLSRR